MIKHSIFAGSLVLGLAAAVAPIATPVALAQARGQAGTYAPESDKPLSLQSQTLLRCSAAFAMVSHGQSTGNEDALKWPALGDRGKEFFVRAMANLMDDTGKSREEISQLVSAEAQRLWDSQTVNDVMPGCLLMLETSDL